MKDKQMNPIGTIIVGVSRNGVIGKDNAIPWNYPADLKRFRKLTSGGTIIMGRKTFESIGRALPNRRNIVISRTKIEVDNVETFNNLKEAIESSSVSLFGCACLDDNHAHEDSYPKIWYIGGRGIYAEALKYAAAIDLTIIPEIIERTGDVVDFPWINPTEFSFAGSESGDNGLIHLKYTRMV